MKRVASAFLPVLSPATAAVLAALLLAGGSGTVRAAAPASMGSAMTGAAALVTVRVKVLAVDLKNRLVDVQGPAGNKWVIEVDERVRRLPEVKAGDTIVIKYYEAVAVDIKKPGTAKVGLVKSEKLTRAEPGQRPAGVLTERTTANVEVILVNRGDNSVTFKNPQGHTEWIKVKDPQLKPYVKKLKQGDIISITYDEALAVSVEPA
jgi:hypothetical protein